MPDPAIPLRVRECRQCGAVETGGRRFCANCGNGDFATGEVEGEGELVSWTIVRRPAAAFRQLGVIPIAVVRLSGGAIVTGRFDAEPSDLHPGTRMVHVGTEDLVPRFRPAGAK